MAKSKRYSLRGGKYKSRKIRKSNKQRKSRNIKRTRKINNKRKGGVFGMGFNKDLSKRSNWNEIVNTVTDPKNVDKTFSMELNCETNNPIKLKGFILEPETMLEDLTFRKDIFKLMTVKQIGLNEELENFNLSSLPDEKEVIKLQNKNNNFEKLWLLENENGNVIVYYLNNRGIIEYNLCLKSKLNRSQSVGDLVEDMSEKQIMERHTY